MGGCSYGNHFIFPHSHIRDHPWTPENKLFTKQTGTLIRQKTNGMSGKIICGRRSVVGVIFLLNMVIVQKNMTRACEHFATRDTFALDVTFVGPISKSVQKMLKYRWYQKQRENTGPFCWPIIADKYTMISHSQMGETPGQKTFFKKNAEEVKNQEGIFDLRSLLPFKT